MSLSDYILFEAHCPHCGTRYGLTVYRDHYIELDMSSKDVYEVSANEPICARPDCDQPALEILQTALIQTKDGHWLCVKPKVT